MIYNILYKEIVLKYKGLCFVVFLCTFSMEIFANPQEVLSECFSYFSKNESELIDLGAKCISELDLRVMRLSFTKGNF